MTNDNCQHRYGCYDYKHGHCDGCNLAKGKVKMTNKEVLKIASWLVTDDLCEEQTEYCNKSCIECQYAVQERLRQMVQYMEDRGNDAPTVETSKIEHKAYNEGFKDGVEQGIKLSQTPGEWIETKHRVNLLIGVLYSNQVISKSDLEYIEDSIKKLMKGERAGAE